MADDADVLRGLAKTDLILQLHGQLTGLLVPGPRLGQAPGVVFGRAEEIVGQHHRTFVARLLKELERLLVEAGSTVELLAIIGQAALMLEERSPRDTDVEQIMAKNILCLKPEQTVEEGMALMTDKRIRHLPVVNGDQVEGIISIGDLVKAIIAEQQFVIEQLEHYVTG